MKKLSLIVFIVIFQMNTTIAQPIATAPHSIRHNYCQFPCFCAAILFGVRIFGPFLFPASNVAEKKRAFFQLDRYELVRYPADHIELFSTSEVPLRCSPCPDEMLNNASLSCDTMVGQRRAGTCCLHLGKTALTTDQEDCCPWNQDGVDVSETASDELPQQEQASVCRIRPKTRLTEVFIDVSTTTLTYTIHPEDGSPLISCQLYMECPNPISREKCEYRQQKNFLPESGYYDPDNPCQLVSQENKLTEENVSVIKIFFISGFIVTVVLWVNDPRI